MRKIKEVLRLKWGQGLSIRKIAASRPRHPQHWLRTHQELKHKGVTLFLLW